MAVEPHNDFDAARDPLDPRHELHAAAVRFVLRRVGSWLFQARSRTAAFRRALFSRD